MSGRKPFSSKQKKAQLQEKRKRKAQRGNEASSDSDSEIIHVQPGHPDQQKTDPCSAPRIRSNAGASSSNPAAAADSGSSVEHSTAKSEQSARRPSKREKQEKSTAEAYRIDHELPTETAARILKDTMADMSLRNRRFMHLFLEPDSVVQQQKKLRSVPYQRKRHNILEFAGKTDLVQVPRRPEWTYEMSREEVEKNEEEMFQRWMMDVFSRFKPTELNYFECNLEMWRQMWRTMERSDTVAVITDIRHPLLHVPKNLIEYITVHNKRKMTIVLNKCDLVSPQRQQAWVDYFKLQYPHIPSILFSSRRADVHCSNLIDLFTEIGATKVGMIGHPSVGKSSLLNALVERKVASTSRTPGHTKHFQTFFVSKELMLVDCPGLMFPVTGCDRHVQILCGLFPLAQVREPYSAIRTLAEHVPTPLEEHFQLKFPSEELYGQVSDVPGAWSPFGICVAYAVKKGYMNKGGAPNVHRAAYEILRDCVDGVIDFSFEPPLISAENPAAMSSNDEPKYNANTAASSCLDSTSAVPQ
eukprot:ANDGO_03390.mRNA.1 GTPase LSG1-2